MKKIYLALVALAMPFASAFADAYQVPYRSTLTQDGAVSPDWTVVDADNDGSVLGTGETGNKWAYPAGYTAPGGFNAENPAGLTFYGKDKKVYDDRIVSPAIHLEAGKEYKVRFALRNQYNAATNYRFSGSLYLASGDDAQANTKTKEIKAYNADLATSNVWYTEGSTFSVDADGDYRIALSVTANEYYYGSRLYVTNFSVTENVFVPAAPSDFTVTAGTADDARAMSVTLSWTNPSTDIDGAPFPAGKTLEKVSIYRDGGETPVKEITDGATTWTDTEATGLTGGHHTYEIEAVVSGATTGRTTAASGFVGPVSFDVPCEISLTDQADYNLMWTAEEGSGWTWTQSDKGARMWYSTDHSWLFSPELKFAKAGRYELTLTAGYVGEGGSMKVALATAATAEAMAEGVVEAELAIAQTARGTGAETDVVTLDIAAPGTYRLGFSVNEVNNGSCYFINSIKIDAVPAELYLLCALNEFTQDYMYRLYSEDGETYTLYTDFLAGGFKIASGRNSFPAYSFSTATPVKLGEAATLTDGETANATIAGEYDYVGEVQMTFTLSTGQLMITGTPQRLGAPDALYMVGDVDGTAGSTTAPTQLTKSESTFTLDKVKIDDSGDGYGYFTLEIVTVDTPEELQWYNRYGAATEGAELTSGTETDAKLYVSGINSAECLPFKAAAGYYSIKVDADARKVTLTTFVPDDLYLMTKANGFTATDGYKFATADGESYTLSLDRLAGGFKVASDGYSPHNFSIAGTAIKPGEKAVLTNGVNDNATIALDGNDYLSDVTIAFTLSTGEITVNGTPAKVGTPEKLYILGNVNGTNWSTADGIEMTREGDTFTSSAVTVDGGDSGFGYFSFVTVTGADWDAVNTGDRFGALTKDEPIAAGTAADFTAYLWDNNSDSAPSWKVAAGTYNVTVDFATRKVLLGIYDGIGDILSGDSAAAVEYFDLRGVRVDKPAAGGVYIERRGADVRKVVVK